MPLPASDTFSGTAGQDLTAYSGSWTAAFSTSANQLECNGSDSARVAVGNVEAGDFWNADTFNARQYSEAVLAVLTEGDRVGVLVRAPSVGNNYGGYADDNDIEPFENTGGTWSALGSQIGGLSWGSGTHTLRVEADGTTISFIADGGAPTTRTDATHATGAAGVTGFTANAPSVALINSWEGGDLPIVPVAFTAIGAKTITGTTTVSIAHPTGTAADQVLLAGRVGWYSDITLSNESGWTDTGRQPGGNNGAAADNHTTEVGIDRKEISGADAGPTVFDQVGGTQPGIVGIMASYTKAPSTATWDFATSAGTDDTHAANRSVTGSTSIPLAVGDVVVAVVAVGTDASLTITAPAITASGITFGATTQRAPVSAGSIAGHDGNIYWFDATVTAGSGTAAPVLNFTTATSQSGPVAFVRLRAVSAVTGPPPVRRRDPGLTLRR